jgi:hypothetical protein
MPIIFNSVAGIVHLSNENTSYVMQLSAGGDLIHFAWM